MLVDDEVREMYLDYYGDGEREKPHVLSEPVHLALRREAEVKSAAATRASGKAGKGKRKSTG